MTQNKIKVVRARGIFHLSLAVLVKFSTAKPYLPSIYLVCYFYLLYILLTIPSLGTWDFFPLKCAFL